MEKYLVYDIGGTYVKYALMNDEYQIYEQGKKPSATDSAEHLMEVLKEINAGIGEEYKGIAVSMPGRIDTARGIAHTGGAYQFIHDLPFAKMLEDEFGKKAVIGNDAKCAGQAELLSGAMKDTECGAVIVLGTGTGGAIIMDHKVWMGVSGGAGELSNLVTDIDRYIQNLPMLDGLTSTFSAYGSASGLLMQYAKFRALPRVAGFKMSGTEFFEDYDNGSLPAKEALKMFGRYTAAGIMSVQAVLDLERYAIGGGISARKEITESIREGLDYLYDARNNPFSKPEIVTCVHHNEANLIGALSFYKEYAEKQ